MTLGELLLPSAEFSNKGACGDSWIRGTVSEANTEVIYGRERAVDMAWPLVYKGRHQNPVVAVLSQETLKR